MSDKKVIKNIRLEGARILWPNFSGKEDKYNPKGNRNFTVLLEDPEVAKALMAEGWNVRERPPRDEDGEPWYILNVAVGYNYPPKVVLVASNGTKTELGESDIGKLDFVEFENIDLLIRPYNYNVNGTEGVKAYLKIGYFTLIQDEFADKYPDPIPVSTSDLPFDLN